MKKKYFVRGLGVGIIFGALIMLAAYMTSGKKSISDEEVIARAKKLGMVKESEYVLTGSTDSDATNKSLDELVQESAEMSATATQATTEVTTEATTEATTEQETTQATTEATTEKATTEATTEKATTEKPKKEDAKVTITVSGGMSSETISGLLEDAGLVDSASKFNRFLVEKGYDMKLETGSFEIKTGMSYEEIAKILTTKQ